VPQSAARLATTTEQKARAPTPKVGRLVVLVHGPEGQIVGIASHIEFEVEWPVIVFTTAAAAGRRLKLRGISQPQGRSQTVSAQHGLAFQRQLLHTMFVNCDLALLGNHSKLLHMYVYCVKQRIIAQYYQKVNTN
jgi:hypothetical protein